MINVKIDALRFLPVNEMNPYKQTHGEVHLSCELKRAIFPIHLSMVCSIGIPTHIMQSIGTQPA